MKKERKKEKETKGKISKKTKKKTKTKEQKEALTSVLFKVMKRKTFDLEPAWRGCWDGKRVLSRQAANGVEPF